MERESNYERATKLVKMWVEDSKRDSLTIVQSHINLIILVAKELNEAEHQGFDDGWEEADRAHIEGEMEMDDGTESETPDITSEVTH